MSKKRSVVTGIPSAFALLVLTRNPSSYIFPYTTLSIGEDPHSVHTLRCQDLQTAEANIVPSVKYFSNFRYTGTLRKPRLHFKKKACHEIT